MALQLTSTGLRQKICRTVIVKGNAALMGLLASNWKSDKQMIAASVATLSVGGAMRLMTDGLKTSDAIGATVDGTMGGAAALLGMVIGQKI